MKHLWKSLLILSCCMATLNGNPSLDTLPSLVLESSGQSPEENRTTSHPEIITTSGNIVGSSLPEAHAFYSIPYGKAPVGELRLEPPQPFLSSEQINASIPNYVRCFEFPLNCTSGGECGTNHSEDCLVLNINIPSNIDLSTPPSERLPVLFWIHGGSFSAGAGTDPLYDGRWLSNSTNAVVVTINYRLDSLGFLYYEENGKTLGGNQGFKDQQLALQWVQDNIEKFAGDKNKVTIFGNSAGAQAISYHLISEKSNPLFSRAIIQSNPAAIPFITKQESQNFAEKMIASLNCSESGYDCLKNAPARTLMDNHVNVIIQESNIFNIGEPFRPVLDGIEFTEHPLDAFQAGRWQTNKDVIVGHTTEETMPSGGPISRFVFELTVQVAVGTDLAPAVINEYAKLAGNNPPDDYNYQNISAQFQSDLVFVCPGRAMARFMSSSTTSQQPSDVYYYITSYPMDSPNCQQVLQYCGTPYHTSEIYFVFNSGPSTGLIFSETDTAVSNVYANFWGHFAHFGNPSTTASVWPKYTDASSTIKPWSNIRIPNQETYIEQEYRKDACDFMDSLNIYVDMTPNDSSSSLVPSSVICLTIFTCAMLVGF